MTSCEATPSSPLFMSRQGLSKLPRLVLHYSVAQADFELEIFLPQPPE